MAAAAGVSGTLQHCGGACLACGMWRDMEHGDMVVSELPKSFSGLLSGVSRVPLFMAHSNIVVVPYFPKCCIVVGCPRTAACGVTL